jgi:hypothetical protein
MTFHNMVNIFSVRYKLEYRIEIQLIGYFILNKIERYENIASPIRNIPVTRLKGKKHVSINLIDTGYIYPIINEYQLPSPWPCATEISSHH